MSTSQQVPIDEELFREVDGALHLVGARCEDCSNTTFPRSPGCPRCGSEAMRETVLSRRGTLWTFTTQGFPPKTPYIGPADPETFESFALGYVELPDGVLVEGRLTESDPQRLSIGMELELDLVPLTTDAEGRELLTYAFRPVA